MFELDAIKTHKLAIYSLTLRENCKTRKLYQLQ